MELLRAWHGVDLVVEVERRGSRRRHLVAALFTQSHSGSAAACDLRQMQIQRLLEEQASGNANLEIGIDGL
ncbi:hypothetical protein EJB05_49756, partial [Eragrostis curvula]